MKEKTIRYLFCFGCEELVFELNDDNFTPGLCNNCNDKYENKTGYCSLSCCLSGDCDQSC